MIEFKADCGHTVRAKDEDAGKVVRCAYCGREAEVPRDDQDGLDFLFSDANSGDGDADSAVKKNPASKTRRADRGKSPFAAGQTRVDPFAVVKKMSYVAAVLVCLIFVGKKYALPMIEGAFDDDGSSKGPRPVVLDKPVRNTGEGATPAVSSNRFGFLPMRLDQRGKEGVYVNSVPVDAIAYHRAEAGRDTVGFDWIREDGTERVEVPEAVDLEIGTHVFVVMIPVNDREVKRRFRAFGYDPLRRMIESSAAKAAGVAAADYFRPDAATDVAVVRSGGKINIARRYEVQIEKDAWSILTPQFLPYNCHLRDVVNFVGRTRDFGFDDAELMEECDFYGVDKSDGKYLVDILHSIGTISYRQVDDSFRMFTIDPFDGMISAPPLKGAHRKAPELGNQ